MNPITKHTVTFALTKNMLAKNGELRLSLLFLDSSNKQILSSFPFTIKVIQAPAGTIQESELTAITDSLLDAAKYAAESKTYYENLTLQKGKPNGIAELNEDGKIPLSQTYCVNEIWNSTEPSTIQRDNDYWLQEY